MRARRAARCAARGGRTFPSRDSCRASGRLDPEPQPRAGPKLVAVRLPAQTLDRHRNGRARRRSRPRRARMRARRASRRPRCTGDRARSALSSAVTMASAVWNRVGFVRFVRTEKRASPGKRWSGHSRSPRRPELSPRPEFPAPSRPRLRTNRAESPLDQRRVLEQGRDGNPGAFARFGPAVFLAQHAAACCVGAIRPRAGNGLKSGPRHARSWIQPPPNGEGRYDPHFDAPRGRAQAQPPHSTRITTFVGRQGLPTLTPSLIRLRATHGGHATLHIL